MRLTSGLLLASLLLTACADDAPDDPGLLTVADGGLALSADGLGTLGAATPFDSVAVQQALGDVTVEASPAGAPGEAAVWVLRDGQLLAEVYGGADGAVRRVEVTGDLPGPDSLIVGQSFAESGLSRRDCAPATGDWEGSVRCSADGVEFLFAHGWEGPTTELPPDDALGDAFLKRMIWQAD